MPLLDHFHAPLFPLRPWESFHAFWAAALGEWLNGLLPPRYFAALHTYLGTRIEADVAEFEQAAASGELPNGSASLPAVFPDDVEVQVLDTRDGARLVGVLELVSPGNLDRPEARRVFAAKVAAYLARGVGVLVVDVVTSHHFNLHNELIDLLRAPAASAMLADAALYAAAYRPTQAQDASRIDVWLAVLALSAALPVLPLPLLGAASVPWTWRPRTRPRASAAGCDGFFRGRTRRPRRRCPGAARRRTPT
jgi:hypothetical protein